MATDDRGLWIKLYQNLVDDPKFARLSDIAKSLYYELYCLAGISDAGGLILVGKDIADIDKIAWRLRRPDDLLKIGLSELSANELISLDDNQVIVARYADEQGPSHEEQREAWRIRQDRHREKTKKESNKEKEKELKIKDKESESESESDSHTDVTGESRVTSADDELIEYLTKNTLIKVTDSILQEIHDRGASLAEIRAKVENQRRNGAADKFKTVKGLLDWKIMGRGKAKITDPEKLASLLDALINGNIDRDYYAEETGLPAPTTKEIYEQFRVKQWNAYQGGYMDQETFDKYCTDRQIQLGMLQPAEQTEPEQDPF